MIVFPIITLSVVGLLTRYITKTWISPGAFFCLCWSFFLTVPIVFAYNYKTDHLALWFITIFSISLAAGSIIAFSKNSIVLNHDNQYASNFNNQILFKILLLLSSISFIGIFLLFRYATTIYSYSNYINDWMMIPNMIAIDRYAGILNYPSTIKYSLYFIYPANLLGGLLFGSIHKSKKIQIFSTLPLFAAIILGIIEGTRTSILLGLVMFFSAWLSSFMVQRNQLINFKRSYFKFILALASFIFLFTIFFIFIQWLRQGMDELIFDLLIDRIRAYFFGYLAAFSQWLSGNIEYNSHIGFITFAGPFNLFGIMDRPLGFYDATQIASGISTNIFTAFRGIITDFSIPGSILIAFAIGFITQEIFQNKKNISLLTTLPISMFYAFTLYSPLISIFHYNSILFSWFILLIILLFVKYESVDNHS